MEPPVNTGKRLSITSLPLHAIPEHGQYERRFSQEDNTHDYEHSPDPSPRTSPLALEKRIDFGNVNSPDDDGIVKKKGKKKLFHNFFRKSAETTPIGDDERDVVKGLTFTYSSPLPSSPQQNLAVSDSNVAVSPSPNGTTPLGKRLMAASAPASVFALHVPNPSTSSTSPPVSSLSNNNSTTAPLSPNPQQSGSMGRKGGLEKLKALMKDNGRDVKQEDFNNNVFALVSPRESSRKGSDEKHRDKDHKDKDHKDKDHKDHKDKDHKDKEHKDKSKKRDKDKDHKDKDKDKDRDKDGDTPEKKKGFLTFRRRSISSGSGPQSSTIREHVSSPSLLSSSGNILPPRPKVNSLRDLDPDIPPEFDIPAPCKDSLEALMKDPAGVKLFFMFCMKEKSDNLLMFWNQARHFQKGGALPGDLLNDLVGVEVSHASMEDVDKIKLEADAIFYTYIARGAPSEMSIQPIIRAQLEKHIAEGNIHRDMFDRLTRSTYDEISREPFARFVKLFEPSEKELNQRRQHSASNPPPPILPPASPTLTSLRALGRRASTPTAPPPTSLTPPPLQIPPYQSASSFHPLAATNAHHSSSHSTTPIPAMLHTPPHNFLQTPPHTPTGGHGFQPPPSPSHVHHGLFSSSPSPHHLFPASFATSGAPSHPHPHPLSHSAGQYSSPAASQHSLSMSSQFSSVFPSSPPHQTLSLSSHFPSSPGITAGGHLSFYAPSHSHSHHSHSTFSAAPPSPSPNTNHSPSSIVQHNSPSPPFAQAPPSPSSSTRMQYAIASATGAQSQISKAPSPRLPSPRETPTISAITRKLSISIPTLESSSSSGGGGERFGVAFGIKRGACNPPCDCEFYQPAGDNGGQCQNCGHFPSVHVNLGKVDTALSSSPQDIRIANAAYTPPLSTSSVFLSSPLTSTTTPSPGGSSTGSTVSPGNSSSNLISPHPLSSSGGRKDFSTGRSINDLSPSGFVPLTPTDGETEDIFQGMSNWTLDADEIAFKDKIGEGSAAKVYRGIWRNQDVAIKVLKNAPDSSELSEFKKELEIMSALRSPFIVYFFGMVVRPKVCMIMEYCGHKSLYHVMNTKGELGWDRVFAFTAGAIRGINSLHNWSPPILHRDLKSLNLLITETWAIKIADFGLSRFHTGDLATLSKVRGTYAYCAPEVYFGQQYTIKSDIYSMGIVIWELVTRFVRGRYERPFAEHKHIQYDFQIIIQAAKENLRPTISSSCPEGLANIIRLCLDPNPEIRPSGMQLLEMVLECEKVYMDNKKKWDKIREKPK